MPNLSETIGSLLADIAGARAKSDAFTRDIGQAYLQDPLMQLMPVPRAEIRSVELELSFAITEAQSQPVDNATIVRRVLAEETTTLAAALSRVETPRTRSVTTEPGTVPPLLTPDQRGMLQSALKKRLSEVLLTDIQPTMLLSGDAAVLTKVLQKRVLLAYTDSATEANMVLPSASALQQALDTVVRGWAQDASERAKQALERARANALQLKLAITQNELISVPPAAMAKLKLQIEVQNLEWIENPGDDGTSNLKLIPR